MKKKFCLLYVFVFAAFLLRCTTIQKEWNRDASGMTGEMKKHKKDAMLFFTGSDWDIKSKEAFAAVNTEEFFEKYGKNFILYNIDIVKNEELMSAGELKNNYILFSEYKVDNLPYLALKNTDGDVYFSESINLDENPLKAFKEIIDSALNKRDKLDSIKEDIKKFSGAEKTASIDLFFQSIYNPEEARYDALRETALQSDPENKSGLKGKFVFFIARLKADKLSAQKKYIEAAQEFKKAVESKSLEAEAEQAAWYNIAYLYTMSKQIDSEQIIACLNNAIKANPAGEAVPNFKRIIEDLKTKK